MIYFIYGDSKNIFTKSNQLIENLVSKNPDATFLKIDKDNFNEYNIDELIGGQSLFTKKQIVYLKRIFEDKDLSEIFLSKIKEIKNSENIFVVAEEKLNKKDFNKIEKNSEKTQIFEVKENKKEKDNSVFQLTDAFGNKDLKKLWSLYVEKVKYIRPEEIHGILWWQIKSMLSVLKSKDVKDSGLKPFVYNKNKRFNQNFTEEELEEKANQLVILLHKSRRSGLDLETALEKFILSI
jgi:hypothetical protein